MESQNMLSKTIGLQRTALANTLDVFSTIQHHGEDLLKTTLEQNPWLSRSSKNACLSCVEFYSTFLESLKSAVDQGFVEIERISSPCSKPEKKQSQQTKKTERIRASGPAQKSPVVREETVSKQQTVVANTLPDKKPITQNPSTTVKIVTHEKPEVKKSAEGKVETSIPKPLVASQPTTDPALSSRESARKLLPQKE